MIDPLGSTGATEVRLAQVSRGFAWGYFAAIVIGTIVIIASICALATLMPKQAAKFSMRTEAPTMRAQA